MQGIKTPSGLGMPEEEAAIRMPSIKFAARQAKNSLQEADARVHDSYSGGEQELVGESIDQQVGDEGGSDHAEEGGNIFWRH